MNNTSTLRTFVPRLREERGNCFLYGCVTLVILTILCGLIAFILGRNFVREVRGKYTEEAPIELPTANLPADQAQALIKRVDEYAHDLRAGNPLPSLTLSETEVNALMQNHPDLKDIYGPHLYLMLEDGAVTAKLSIQLDWFPGFSGRYFNGAATFDVQLKDKDIDIVVVSATFKGNEVPEEYMKNWRKHDFAQDWEHNPDAKSLVEKIESITIQKGSLTITPANKADAAAPAPPASAATPAEPTAPK